ncbi:hypothetical protein LguiB_017812 [Lonicera macranthoides]
MAFQADNLTVQKNFQDFFEKWIVEQKEHLHELISMSKSPNQADSSVQNLVNHVLNHYEEYYKVKSDSANENAFVMLSPSWTTILENGFLWIGGWRPTMAFQLLYSKSGLQLETRLDELIQGIQTGDLGDLSPNQMTRADRLQRKTIKEEREITEKMAKQQETVADSEMVELSDVMTALMENDADDDANGESIVNDQVDLAIERKEEGLLRVLGMADDLRLRTLKGVVEILYPKQAIHFLIAAAELHLRLHDWGKQMDEKKTHG